MAEPITARVASSLTLLERATFLENVVKRNPHYRGADVEDILEELNSSDAHVAIVEDFLEDNKNINPQLAATAVRACIYIYGTENVDFRQVAHLITRVS